MERAVHAIDECASVDVVLLHGGKRFKLPQYHIVVFCSAASLKRSTPGTDACSASESWSMAACRAVTGLWDEFILWPGISVGTGPMTCAYCVMFDCAIVL
jgi:hypothetical protein